MTGIDKKLKKIITSKSCNECNGTGRWWFDANGVWGKCPYCKGTGFKLKRR